MKNNLKVERAKLNLTQAKLAKMIGVSRQTINAMELNKYVPSTVLALKISQIVNKNVNEIFFLDKAD
jgi:putative transcriptional regulator